jgi:hypothetical protein
MPDRRHRQVSEYGPRWRRWALIGTSGMAVACNALLDIDEATVTCAPGSCGAEAAPSGAPSSAPALGGVAGGTEERGAASGGRLDVGVGAPTAPANDSPVPATEVIAVSPMASPAAPPIAGRDAGAPAPDMAEPEPDMAEPEPLGPPLDPNGFAVALPNDLRDAPASGEIVFSEEAEWEVDGVFRPTFEVHTPTGSYWIVKSLGTMVSMQDAYAGRLQWIAFSSGFRPLRNIPALTSPPAGVDTVLDRESQTPTHLRLTSDSADGAWHWVWDFYVTHVTLTFDRAPAPIGFSYRGVPAGELGTEDQLIMGDGSAQGARNSFTGDAPGPIEWVYVADTAAERSLFLMQHTDDSLPEAYQVRDNDSAAWVFGNGQITALPIRFSLGLIDSTDHATVSQRVAFVASAIR